MSDDNQPQAGEAGWKWFPSASGNWSLDVVTLLAVIGEQPMSEHSQAITASLFGMLPRLLPAPQALLKPSRPRRMPETAAKQTGVYSGTNLESVGFFANIIHPLDEMPALGFRVMRIRHADAIAGHRPPPAALDGPAVRFVRRLMMAMSSRARKTRRRLEKEAEEESNGTAKSNGASDNGATAGAAAAAAAAASSRPTDEESGQATHTSARDFGAPAGSIGAESHLLQPVQRRATARQTAQDLVSHPTMAVSGDRPAVPATLLSPIHIISVLSMLLSFAMIGCAIYWEDGNAILAISLLSVASTLIGVASWWQPILMQRRHDNRVPAGDVMIRTREGGFLLVHCTDEVARELYSGTEECRYYIGERTYRLLMALGTTIIMISVILLGNCTWSSQIFIAVAYIVLNGVYWGLGMLDRSYFWDLQRYVWEDITPPDCRGAHKVTDASDQREGHPSYTRTLWYAIRQTKRTGWVRISGGASKTTSWDKWLAEAEENAKAGNREWPAVARKNAIMNESVANDEDQAANAVPSSPVRPDAHPTPSSSF